MNQGSFLSCKESPFYHIVKRRDLVPTELSLSNLKLTSKENLWITKNFWCKILPQWDNLWRKKNNS